jgi:hypothetical protein
VLVHGYCNGVFLKATRQKTIEDREGTINIFSIIKNQLNGFFVGNRWCLLSENLFCRFNFFIIEHFYCQNIFVINTN